MNPPACLVTNARNTLELIYIWWLLAAYHWLVSHVFNQAIIISFQTHLDSLIEILE